MHKDPLTELAAEGLRLHGLPIGTPSQLSDAFRHGMGWALAAPTPSSKCQCTVAIRVLGEGCRYCQPQDYIDRLHAQIEEDRAMVVPDGWNLTRNSGAIILKCEGQWSAGFSQYDSSPLSRNLWRLFDAMLAASPAPGDSK
jgi:hypothetical protein